MAQAEEKRPAIVFDFGGVLLDWNPNYLFRHFFTDDQAIARFRAEIGFDEWIRLQDEGYPCSQAVVDWGAKFPHYRDLIRAYDERWEETIGGAIQATVDILQSLHRSGYPLYALSNWEADKFVLMRRRFEFLKLFRVIVISAEVKLAKPDPRIFTLLLDKIGRPANECLFIDDAPLNIAAARRLGFATIQFESPAHLAHALHDMHLLDEQIG
jgi:2-haloacid dehalogenase